MSSEVNSLFCEQCGDLLTSKGCLTCARLDEPVAAEINYDILLMRARSIVNDHSITATEAIEKLRELLF